MGDISPHFSRSEFACKCNYNCGFAAVDVLLLDVLEMIRVHFNGYLIINSGCRCYQHNIDIDGSDNSFHTKAMAADIKVVSVSAYDIAHFLFMAFPNALGIGMYNTFTHIDVRKQKARWDRREVSNA